MTGEIPRATYNIARLESIHLNDNMFSGAIDPSIANLVNIRSLQLQNNRFHRRIPREIKDLNLAGMKCVYLLYSKKTAEPIVIL